MSQPQSATATKTATPTGGLVGEKPLKGTESGQLSTPAKALIYVVLIALTAIFIGPLLFIRLSILFCSILGH